MCRNAEAAPGPPLKTNVTGRSSSLPFETYATEKISAAGFSFLRRTGPPGGGGVRDRLAAAAPRRGDLRAGGRFVVGLGVGLLGLRVVGHGRGGYRQPGKRADPRGPARVVRPMDDRHDVSAAHRRRARRRPQPLALARQVAARDPALRRARVPLDRVRRADASSRSSRSSSPAATRRGSSSSTSACCAGRGAWPSTRTARSAPTATRRSRSAPAPDYPATPRRRLPGAALARARARQVVAARDPAVPHRRRSSSGGGYAASQSTTEHWSAGFAGGLIGLLVLFAGVALLFTTRYPRGIFDFVLGLDRWVARVVAYAALMTDAYPPFRLDQGGEEPAVTAAPEPAAPELRRRADAGEPGGRRAGRVVLIVVGASPALLAFGLLAGGCAPLAVDRTQRDDDGFLMSPTEDFATLDLRDRLRERRPRPRRRRTGRSTTSSDGSDPQRERPPVFVGIAPESDVDGATSTASSTPSSPTSTASPDYSDRAGRRAGRPARRPDVLGRVRDGAGRTDARLGARGRELERRRHERRRAPRRRRRPEHRRRARRPCPGSAVALLVAGALLAALRRGGDHGGRATRPALTRER